MQHDRLMSLWSMAIALGADIYALVDGNSKNLEGSVRRKIVDAVHDLANGIAEGARTDEKKEARRALQLSHAASFTLAGYLLQLEGMKTSPLYKDIIAELDTIAEELHGRITSLGARGERVAA